MRLDNAITLFLSEWPAEGAARGTVRTYRANLEWLSEFAIQHDALYLDDLTPSLLRAAVITRMDPEADDHSPNFKGGEAAAALVVAAARCMARWLLAQGVQVADLRSVKAPRVPERIQPRLYQDEFNALQTAVLRRLVNGSRRIPRVAVSRDLALLHVLGETGLRADELCGMQLGHVDLQRGEILIAHGKGNKERILSIVAPADDEDPWRVVRLLEDWLGTRNELRRATLHAAIWTSMKGNPLSTHDLRLILARMCLEAGLTSNRPPHSFRRYVFTEHYRQRPNALPRISARMGWSTRSHKMVDVYTRGVEVELAREPLPLLNTRGQGPMRVGPKVPLRNGRLSSVSNIGVGPPGGAKLNEPPLTPRGRVARERPASQAPQRRPAPQL